MQNYIVHEEIGKGSFGSVFRATRKKDGKAVAIKKLNQTFGDWNAVRTLRECRANLVLSRDCKYLCQMYDIIRENDGTLYFSMELMPDGTLNDYIQSFRQQLRTSSSGDSNSARTHIGPSSIQSILRQVLRGLEHIHAKGYMHRDLKPENILMRGKECKVTDFSLSRMTVQKSQILQRSHASQECHQQRHGTRHNSPSQPQHHHCNPMAPTHTMHNALHQPSKMTSYVSTRWYRAPEIILCAPQYSTAVDLFALGCVMAELYTLDPLFPGSGEIPQLALICELWGGPLHWHEHWPEGKRLAAKMGLEVVADHHHLHHQNDSHQGGRNPTENEVQVRHHSVESTCRSKLRVKVPSACERALALMEHCLRINPNGRPTASNALQYDFFDPLVKNCPPSSISASPIPVDANTGTKNHHHHQNDNDSIAFLYSRNTPPTTSAEFTNHLSPSLLLDQNSQIINQSAAAVVSTNRDVDQGVFSSAMQSSSSHGSVMGFLSPSNISNTDLNRNSGLLDKHSLLGSIDCKKRRSQQSIIHSNRKKRGKEYKPSRAFFADMSNPSSLPNTMDWQPLRSLNFADVQRRR
ncbi:unnamed protein product [Cylindrotheca closterium]|uniref:Protein kinase domain-containing protein n=1 Tax=Cylindrotheca closterium TaxID=2856 RepID=A0AAD2FQ41_9STRA|nr:unnamed protein product [Cylindrotheca closterium]